MSANCDKQATKFIGDAHFQLINCLVGAHIRKPMLQLKNYVMIKNLQ